MADDPFAPLATAGKLRLRETDLQPQSDDVQTQID